MDKAGGCAEEFALYLSNDMEALRAYQMKRMAQMDINSGLNHALREGFAEGFAESFAKSYTKIFAKGVKQEKPEAVQRKPEAKQWKLEGKRSIFTDGFEEGFAEGFSKSYAEGFSESYAEGQRTIARTLKTMGMPIGEIAEITELSAAEIGRL
jgi:flagellar biosynthesis/type III secretory pathway protein FliH